ncbi:MAG: PilC/PilY family type IV pilus protein [Rhodocyclaceae bacterium]|nr:PilC/PilY family type IV pilus protein [Rhodocyclaceae bacterium]
MSKIKQKIFGLLALLGITFAIVKLSLAITAFTPANQPTGYVAQDEISNYDLTSGSETVFRPEYEMQYYSGNLYAYPVDAGGNINIAAEWWSGGAKGHIDAQNFDTGRLIATLKDNGDKIPFRWSNLSATQQGYLTSSTILDFLRGDRSNEIPIIGKTLRQRNSVLGEIVHSRPYYVADATYPTIFVGANDGMLHAINASTSSGGAERWAVIPSMLLKKMKNLSVNPYVRDYFVDGQINIATLTSSGSKRVLVGGLGGGGKGLYALDITGSTGLTATNEADVASKIVWEITPTKLNYANPAITNATINLGYTYGTPTIAKVQNGSASDAVIIGNGYNDGLGDYANCTHATPNYTNCGGNYQAYLYVLDAYTGQLIRAIQAGTGGTSASPNGLSSPVGADSNGDGVIDLVYAGDLNGTLWKFDLSSPTPASWVASALVTTSPVQPITSTPGIAMHPNGGYMINFATGAMFTTADTTNTAVHYAYGIWDGAPAANAVLLSQTLTERSYTVGSTTLRVRKVTSNVPDWTSGATHHKGWKVALPAGEKVVGEGSYIESGRFYFSSHNPTISITIPATTTVVYGENWLMELDYLSGGSNNQPFLDMNDDVLLNNSDRIKYIASDTLPVTTPATVIGDPILTTDGIPVGKFLSNGVQSQPILVQLRTLNDTLFNQNPNVTFPAAPIGQGVTGGHFDTDIYYGQVSAGTKAVGSVTFTYAAPNTAKNVTALTIVVNGETLYTGTPGHKKPKDLDDLLNGLSSANYTISKNYINNHTIKISAKSVGAAYNQAITVTMSVTDPNSTPVYTKVDLSNGADAEGGDNCTTYCRMKSHIHQYDDRYDVTGLNMLNASNAADNLSNAIPSVATSFKVLAQNQYLSPAAKLHIGDASYLYNVDAGYITLKEYTTSATLDLASLPTYTRANIGSLAINLPIDALTSKDWYGNGDVRSGLHPTSAYCVMTSSGSNDGNMYRPVIPPVNGVDGPGINGWSASTTPATATGVRFNGALVIQVIRANTPNSAIEQSAPGRPEYGWRVKSSNYVTYVLAEYAIYWHHPNNLCYGVTGWTKSPGADNGSSSSYTPATGSTDPKIGSLGSGGTVTSSTTTVVGNVTTITIHYSDSTKIIIQKTANSTGSLTVVTTQYSAAGTVTGTTTEIIANAAGSIKAGGNERGLQARTGRISWHELIR